ncbi:MAG: TonB-dependent receptor [Gammaproteobacteria bacterium]|nr:TonB-dependent receptor [Gammaproteobacteria bacterium]MDH3432225.1 TonB-dependent receptor [Gammaproteobacteria bacterium]
MRFLLTRAVAAILSMAVSSAVLAADRAPHETIVVTATRTDIPLSDAIVPVTVITREEIELSLATDLAELLRVHAGIDIGRNGGPGQATSVFLRGTESNHTLVLIDGVRMNPGTLGGAAIQHIAPEIIERVEIVKGARSALFGTDAIGGVINIITRRAENAYVETGLGTGSFETHSAYVSAGNRSDKADFGVTLNWQDTAGYAPRVDSNIERGYDNVSANLYASRHIGNSEISVRHWQTGGNVEYLDFFLSPVDQDFENSTTAVELNSRIAAHGTSKLIVSFMQDDISQNQVEDFVKSDRVGFDWQYSHAIANHTLTGGLFAIDESASALSFGSGFDADTSVRAAFFQDQWSHDRHRTFVALRLTDHETFGKHTTWNAEYAFDINDVWTFNAGLGHAFRAPDATDRYGFGGNPALNPELADEAQLALRYTAETGHSVNLELYSKDIEDLIEFDLQTFVLDNIARAEIRGVQLGYEYRGDGFVFRTAVTKQSADNASSGARLLRRAEDTATLSVTRDVGEHRIAISLIASGDREDFGGVKLHGYVLADLAGQIRLSDSWMLHARVENLLDTEYQTAANFRMQERSGFIELKYRWD